MPGMAPPGKKPGLVIAVGVGKPKGGGSSSRSSGKEMPPPGLDHVEGHDESDGTGKATREAALFIPSDHHCKDCLNWDEMSGDCQEVEGSFGPEEACLRYFKHKSSEDEEPDEGEPSDPDSATEEMEPPE